MEDFNKNLDVNIKDYSVYNLKTILFGNVGVIIFKHLYLTEWKVRQVQELIQCIGDKL